MSSGIDSLLNDFVGKLDIGKKDVCISYLRIANLPDIQPEIMQLRRVYGNELRVIKLNNYVEKQV